MPRIEEPGNRNALTIEIVRNWRHRDEAAAEAWLSKASLDAETLEIIRRPENNVERRLRQLEKLDNPS